MSKEALEASIKHWEENLQRVQNKELPKVSASDCNLCNLYYKVSPYRCKDCPISIFVMAPGCLRTPYPEITKVLSTIHIFEEWDTLEKLVQEEIDFLKSLRDIEYLWSVK